MFLITFGLGFSQSPFNTNLSPGGLLENVFDNYGNNYKLSDIKIVNDNIGTANRSVLVLCNPTSIFNLYFEPGCGMEGADQTETDRRSVLCQVFKDLSDFITTSSSPIIVNSNKVNIWVRKISNIQGVPANALGLATSFYVTPSSPTEGGIIDNEIWKTIHTGKDSFINTVPPLIPNAPTTGTSGSYYHGMVAFNFNLNTSGTAPLFDWYTMPLTNVAPNNKNDLYSVVLHEVTHALGFASLMNQLGNSQFGLNFKYYSRYDKFLKNNANTAALLTNPTTTSSMYNYGFNPALNTTVLRPGCTLANFENTGLSINNTNSADALKYVGNNGAQMPIYTPTCYEAGSSYSHFEDQLVPPNVNDGYFVMSNGQQNTTPINTKRYLKPEERLALCDLGYSVNSSFGSSAIKLTATISGPYSYGTSSTCTGITVAGTNDGIDQSTGAFTFFGTVNTNIPLNVGTLIANDTFPSGGASTPGIEFLQDMTTGDMLLVSGNSASVTNLNSASAGLHLLRYVPTYGSQKGNITYCFAFFVGIGGNCALPTACNLVSNGDFEQYTTLVDLDSGAIARACGWNNANGNSADYFNAGATGTFPYTSTKVPCNFSGNQDANNNSGNGYVCVLISHIVPFVEQIYTKLNTPLVQGRTYQLSFDISRGEAVSSFANEVQAYLSATPMQSLLGGYLFTVFNNALTPLVDPVLRTNYTGWDRVTFNYTATGGEQYLYFGGLKSAPSIQTASAPHSSSCNYSDSGNAPTSWVYKFSYYYIDNVTLIAAGFDLPAILCPNATLTNLASFLTAGTPSTGIFSGSGVTFDALTGFYNLQFPAGVSAATITYTYTNNLNCIITLQDTISTVIPILTAVPRICPGGTVPILLNTQNGISGTWSPSTISNTASGTYTFTPNAGQCANPANITVLVAQVIPTAPTFPRVCPGGAVYGLPYFIDGISGTWSPPTMSNTTSGTYTFTPNAGQCAASISVFVTVARITPTLPSIGPVICQGVIPPTLPTTLSGITGSWSPPTISNTASGTYTFTPNAGQCANAVTLSVQVIPTTIAAPTIARICPGGSIPPLPSTISGITGTWSPPTISNTTSRTYTFTPNAGQCASNSVSVFVTVATITPTPPTIARICPGGAVPLLPAAINGITGTWSPTTISNTTSRTYTFTPTVGQCANSVSVYVTVATITPTLPNIAPIICQGVAPPQLPATLSGITGTWNPATISNTASGNYTFTPNAGQCANAITINVQVLLPTAFVANDDYLQVNLGGSTTPTTTLSVLYNDSYNGNFNIGTLTGIPPFTMVQSGASIVTPAGGITFNATTGAFQVAGNTTPGTYVFAYFLRTACYDTAVKTVKIEVGNIVSPFKLGFGFCYRPTGISSSTSLSTNPTLFTGTTINGVAADSTNSYINPSTNPSTIGVTINTNGTITLAAGLLPSARVLYYQVCAFNGSGCSAIIAAGIIINSTIAANPDSVTATSALTNGVVNFNVLTNDKYNGTCSSTGVVPAIIGSNVVFSTANPPVNSQSYKIDPITGQVSRILGTPINAGFQSLTYTLCDPLFPNICASAQLVITVPATRTSPTLDKNVTFDIEKTLIAPNPSNGVFNILFNTDVEKVTIELYSIIGQKVFEQISTKVNEVKLIIDRIASGAYLIKIIVGDESMFKRIIIE